MADHVASDGLRLAVDITGPDDARTVVLVHGLAAIASRLADARLVTLAGDDITAVGDPALSEAIVTLARG